MQMQRLNGLWFTLTKPMFGLCLSCAVPMQQVIPRNALQFVLCVAYVKFTTANNPKTKMCTYQNHSCDQVRRRVASAWSIFGFENVVNIKNLHYLLLIHVNDFHVHRMDCCEYIGCTLNDTFSCLWHCDWCACG